MKTILSKGGGMESTSSLALTLLDARFQDCRPDELVFADLGAEWPETYEHLRFIEGICRKEGIKFTRLTPQVLRGKKLFGENRTYTRLYDYLMDVKAVPGKAPNGKRLCTELFKIETIHDYLIEQYPGEKISMLIGFGADEKGRIARGENQVPGWTNRFILDEAGMCRCASIRYLRSIGWPVPRRSGCTFCPFSKKPDFQVQREVYPETFEQTVALERNNRRFNDPVDPFYMVSKNHPVDAWVDTKTPRRKYVCEWCKEEYDQALHLFGDTALYAQYKKLTTKGA